MRNKHTTLLCFSIAFPVQSCPKTGFLLIEKRLDRSPDRTESILTQSAFVILLFCVEITNHTCITWKRARNQQLLSGSIISSAQLPIRVTFTRQKPTSMCNFDVLKCTRIKLKVRDGQGQGFSFCRRHSFETGR